MDESFPERCKLHPHDTEVAGIPWTCLFYMYPYIRTYPTTRNRQKVKMEIIKINTNLTTSTKTWRYYFFGSVFWSCNFRFTGTYIRTLEGHLPIGGIIINHHRPSLGCVQANILQSSWHKAILMKNFRGWNDGLPHGQSLSSKTKPYESFIVNKLVHRDP